MLRRLLFVSLAATVLYGWFVMVYPVLSTDSVRFWSLVLGYTLGSLGSVFVLCRSAMSVWSTTIPAAAALLVVASFRNEAEVHAYLVVAGGTCQQLWDTRELHLVSLDYGGETREVGAIDVNIDQDLVA